MAKSIVRNSPTSPPSSGNGAVVLPFPIRTGVGPADDEIGERLREVFRTNQNALIRFLKSRLGSEHDAQDVAQDAIMRLYQRRTQLFDQDLRSLLFTTAKNITIDRFKEQKRSLLDHSEAAQERLSIVEDETASPERIAIARQELGRIGQLIADLPGKCQMAFINYKIDEMEYGEIAEKMNLTESMVRKYVLRALAHCARQLAEREG
ncbi:hypothetical protein B9N43_04950 [Denitratisoma sp. DHT3]|uniref:RNA polymerase sigma factor n=1 Tax=Denitratisoma sp. DHT3 TaxID=1981880 RepID=UPI0011989E47|nr:RNA polymerase sigma factor [Denitratisoma sp. DHT3]QDX80649.1 hypothetical protein B9N43_04950 [Denitratisoma sp. DHT3]